MKKLITIACVAVLLLHCNQASQHVPASSLCDTPIDRACSNDTCCFVNVYNKDTVLISEGQGVFSNGKFTFAWDGRDRNGNPVGCGAYIEKMTTILSGRSTTKCLPVVVTIATSVTARGRASCDSLHQQCAGDYSEFQMGSFSDTGLSQIDSGCVCCQR